ncbi:MAG: hypothetical protein KC466_12265, partial [Myxococcales bacterium]|nr:hypothetical protein [Myxococcales bacterium]
MRAKSIRWVAAVAVVSAAPSHSTAAPGGADRPDGPDFIAVVGALGLGPLRSLARRGSTMLGAVLDQDGRLADALDDLTSGETSGFQMSGVAGDAPPIAWEPEDYRRPLRAPADFRLRAQAIRRDGARSVNGAFKTVVTASPAATREFVERLVESFHSGDEALLAAFRRDFPGLARVAGRVVDLDAVRVAEPGESYDVLKMRFPFDRKAMSKHYPTLGALIRFLRVATTTVTDEEGRVAFVTHLDNGDGSFEIKAFSSGRDLLWSDGRRPLRGMGGALMPIEFDPAGQARYQAHVDAEATLLKVAGVSLASFRLPHSRWDLRYEGGEGGRRAAWSLR